MPKRRGGPGSTLLSFLRLVGFVRFVIQAIKIKNKKHFFLRIRKYVLDMSDKMQFFNAHIRMCFTCFLTNFLSPI